VASAGTEHAQHGGVGGEPFAAPCPGDQLVIGMRALADDNFWGLGLNCGRLELIPGSSVVNVLPLDQLPLLGGSVEPAPPLLEFACPPQMVVTAAAWTLWQPFEAMQQVLKQLQLTCSELRLGADGQLELGPTVAVLPAGVVGESDSPVLQACDFPGAVSGFTGRSGGALDALATRCALLSVEPLPAELP
jgi:hypothetical protein